MKTARCTHTICTLTNHVNERVAHKISNSPCFRTLRKRNVQILLQSAFPLQASRRFLDSRRTVREFRDASKEEVDSWQRLSSFFVSNVLPLPSSVTHALASPAGTEKKKPEANCAGIFQIHHCWTLQADRCISWDWLSKHSEACKVGSHPASAHGWCGKKLQYSESDLHGTQKHSHNWTPGHAHESSSWGAQECTRVESVGGEGCGEVVVVQGQEAVQKKCSCAFYLFQVITDQMPVWRFPSVFESSHMLPIFC